MVGKSVGVLSSTTGNVYGVYDMSGGAYEYTANWDTLGDISGSNSFVSKNGKSTEYATAYRNGTTERIAVAKIFEVSKVGDSIKEVRKSSKEIGWFDDRSEIATKDYVYFARGGYYSCGGGAGIFYVTRYTGGQAAVGLGTNNGSFRVVLAK